MVDNSTTPQAGLTAIERPNRFQSTKHRVIGLDHPSPWTRSRFDVSPSNLPFKESHGLGEQTYPRVENSLRPKR